jgi:hypothetical protein
MRIKRIVALITVGLLLAGCAALKPSPGKPDNAKALYLQNRCLGGIGEAFRGPYSCLEADNSGLSFSGGGPGFTAVGGAPAVGGAR